MSLESHISESFKSGLQYNDAAQLCLRLFCTLDGVPDKYHAECNKDNLSTVFANLSVNGLVIKADGASQIYKAESYSINDNFHWLTVIDSIFIVGGTVDSEIGNRLICHITTRPEVDN